MFMHVVSMSMHVACRAAQHRCAVTHMASRGVGISTLFPQGVGAFLGVKLKSTGLCGKGLYLLSHSSALEKDLVLLRQGLTL